ncbi:MAG: Na/Pi cotransporter family protein [Clostridia bacterium]|nr:Na/Pi cotransporter family protein [Clostridia bacterium]
METPTFDIFNIITLFGGLAFFLFGMNTMSKGLEKMAGSKFELILKRMTSGRFKSLLLGVIITVAVQSSSAVTVMLVGLVNSGIMQLGQTIGVIMGSNIGTTLTAWLLSLVGIESDNFFMQLLNPDTFAPIFAFIGIAMIMLAKKDKRRDLGAIFVGFAILMYGMDLMSGAVSPLGDIPEFQQILTAFNNPFLGVLVGAVFTGVIQSSAASVGILQALSLAGGITYSMAIPIIMGQNIGTCVTALISSIGANKNAKKVATVHICFNLIGTAVCLILFYGLDAIFHFPFADKEISPFEIAVCHSIFNLATTFMLLPFTRQLEWLAMHIGTKKESKPSDTKQTFLDARLLQTPSLAVTECTNKTVEMAHLAKEAIESAINSIYSFDERTAERIVDIENIVDRYEDKLGTFLVQLSNKDLSDSDNNEIARILHTIGPLERISDHAVDILDVGRELHTKGISFSNDAKEELKVINKALFEVLDITFRSFETDDVELAKQVEPLEQVIDLLSEQLKARHVARLQQGLCTIELGFIHSDLLSYIERTSDQCSNIAVCTIRLKSNKVDTHKYLREVKTSGQPQFESAYRDYANKYNLPE